MPSTDVWPVPVSEHGNNKYKMRYLTIDDHHPHCVLALCVLGKRWFNAKELVRKFIDKIAKLTQDSQARKLYESCEDATEVQWHLLAKALKEECHGSPNLQETLKTCELLHTWHTKWESEPWRNEDKDGKQIATGRYSNDPRRLLNQSVVMKVSLTQCCS